MNDTDLLGKSQLELYEIAIDDSIELSIRYKCCRLLKENEHDHYNPHLGDMGTFIQTNKGMVHTIANRCLKKTKLSVDLADLEQEGYIGLIKAYHYYDPSKGAISTLAYPLIRTEIMMYLRDKLPSIRPPRNAYDLIGRIFKCQMEESSPEVVAKVMDVTVEAAKKALWHIEYGITSSLNQPLRDLRGEEVEYAALIGFCEDETGIEVESFLNTLPDKVKRTVLYLMAGYERKDIANEFGVSRMWVGKLIEKAQDLYLKDRRRSAFGL